MTRRLLACAALAACHGAAPSPTPATPAKPIAVTAEPPAKPAPAPPADTADRDRAALVQTLLAQIGQQALVGLDRDFPLSAITPPPAPPPPPPDPDSIAPPGNPPAGHILALGPCTRPTDAERAAIEKAVAATDPEQFYEVTAFGCVDPAGTIVDVRGETMPSGHPGRGTWSVLRVDRRGKVATLATYTGTPMTAWSEWANEVAVGTTAVVDLDGDGNHDAIVHRWTHEGGSNRSDIELATWMSRTHREVSFRGAPSFGDNIDVARGQVRAAGKPVVLAITDHDPTRPRAYRCVEPTGKVDICEAIVKARAVDDAVDIAGWFIAGDHEFEFGAHVPHHDLLVQLLDTLQTPPSARAQVLAAAPETTPGMRVAGVIRAALLPPFDRAFGELTGKPLPVDPRPAQLMAVLGDRDCPAASAAARAAAVARVSAYAAANDRAALVARGDCPTTGRCRFDKTSRPEVLSSCTDDRGARGYYAVHWTYPKDSEMVVRDAVFYIDGKGAKLVALSTATGQRYECPACGQPTQEVDAHFVRHGAALVALVEVHPADEAKDGQRRLVWAAEGIATTIPAADTLGWYTFGDDQAAAGAVRARDVVRLQDGAWHWDAGWQKVPEPAAPVDAKDAPPDPTARFMWDEAQHEAALRNLAYFNPDEWPGNRDLTLAVAALAGFDAATIARIAAIH